MIIQQKWVVFSLAFLSYSVIHAIRTSWGAIKPQMIQQPYNYSQQFTGEMDMVVLLSLAICLHTFGWLSGTWNVKYFLLGGMVLLVVTQILFGIILLSSSTGTTLYFLFFGLIGAFSCTGWPSVFFIISKYFTKQNTIALCIFNAASQFGDILALLSSQIIIKVWKPKDDNIATSSVIFSITSLVILMIIIDFLFLKPKKQQQTSKIIQTRDSDRNLSKNNEYHLNSEKNLKLEFPEQIGQSKQNNNQFITQNLSIKTIQNKEKQLVISNNIQVFQIEDQSLNLAKCEDKDNINEQEVNGLNVWCLPSVFLIVLSFSMIKTMNTLAADWFVDYFALIGLSQQGRILEILWALSLFAGGISCAIYNSKLKNSIFAAQLIATGIVFWILQQFDKNPNTFLISSLIMISGFLFGGPYYLIATAVPLMLGQKQEIKNRPGAIAAIISVMQGSGQLVGALMMAIIPTIGLINVFYISTGLTVLAGSIIIFIILKDKFKQSINKQVNE